MADEKTKQLRLANITIDAGIQPRAKGLNEAKVEEYRVDIEGGDEFPPLVVYQSSNNTIWLSEGFHRAEAYKRAGIKQVACVVRKGERKDARLNACGSNYAHGLPRTNDDKRRALEMVLEDFPTWSNPQIAKAARVSVEFVRKHRPAEEGEMRETSDGRKHPARSGAPATVAGAPSKTPEKPTIAPVEDDAEPDAEYLAGAAIQAAEDYGVTPAGAADIAEAVLGLRNALRDHGGPPAEPLVIAPEPEPVEEPEPTDPGDEFVASVETVCRDADQLAARMKALKASPFAYSIHVDSAVSQIEAARKTLWQGRPAHVCPYCKGADDKCRACQGTGRVKKTTFDSGTKAVGEAA